MADFDIYCPFSGATQKAIDCYCLLCSDPTKGCDVGTNCCNDMGACRDCAPNACKHKTGINNMIKPMDISGPANTAVKLFVSSNISSYLVNWTGPKTNRRGNGCFNENNNDDHLCLSPPPSGFCWVDEGVLVDLYAYSNGCGYIGSIFYGHLINRHSKGLFNFPNGKIIGYIGSTNCNCDCYKGFHVHLECSSGGMPSYRACGTPISTTSRIYRWTRSTPLPC